MLKPGGKLLLVTCSIWPMESELQAATFAQRHGAIRLDAPGQLLPESDGTTIMMVCFMLYSKNQQLNQISRYYV